MTALARLAWLVYGAYVLLLAVGSFPYSLWAALVFWAAAVGVVAYVLARRLGGAYVAAVLVAVGPAVFDLTVGSRPFGVVYLVVNAALAAAMAAFAAVARRRAAADRY